MNLAEFIEANHIECTDGEQFSHSPEFYQIERFGSTRYEIHGIPFLDPETYKARRFDVVLTGHMEEERDGHTRRTKQQFFVNHCFRYPDSPEGLEEIEDTVPAGRSIDAAMKALIAEKDHLEFFQRYDLIDTGRYWLNRDLRRCIVMDGQVVEMDRGEAHD